MADGICWWMFVTKWVLPILLVRFVIDVVVVLVALVIDNNDVRIILTYTNFFGQEGGSFRFTLLSNYSLLSVSSLSLDILSCTLQ